MNSVQKMLAELFGSKKAVMTIAAAITIVANQGGVEVTPEVAENVTNSMLHPTMETCDRLLILVISYVVTQGAVDWRKIGQQPQPVTDPNSQQP